jgi:hypothetical protein
MSRPRIAGGAISATNIGCDCNQCQYNDGFDGRLGGQENHRQVRRYSDRKPSDDPSSVHDAQSCLGARATLNDAAYHKDDTGHKESPFTTEEVAQGVRRKCTKECPSLEGRHDVGGQEIRLGLSVFEEPELGLE